MSTLTPTTTRLDVWQARHIEQAKLARYQRERRTAWARYGHDAAERVEELDALLAVTQERVINLGNVLLEQQRKGTP